MKSLGICIGASTLSAVEVVKQKNGYITAGRIVAEPHQGNPRDALLSLFAGLVREDPTRIVLTGRKLRHAIPLSSISEPEAIETALHHLNGQGKRLDAVISAGGENFLVYILDPDGRICAVKRGNKCASGTGEFFVQQLRRIGLSLQDTARFAYHEKPYRVSGRCSVFCKSDCTHATNKGIAKERIVSGLCEMIAGKILEIIRQAPGRENIMLIGGLALNKVVVDCLRGKVKDLVVPQEAPYFEALGAALWGLGHETAPLPERKNIFQRRGDTFSYLEPLCDFQDRVEFKGSQRGTVCPGDRCILGLDVGSTTTKAVLVRMEDDSILLSEYLRTDGNPIEASRACISSLLDQLGDLADRIAIVGVGVTGSGRQIAGLYAMTDGVINEIIAHATGALFYDPEVDTIFEIGGQDAKYTFIYQGTPADYAMNDACSAGTGSFLEEVTRETMGVAMEDIGSLALAGQKPPNFNDQCAAFISSDIKNAFQEGLTREDILAGLVYSICMNYTNRVKGNRPVGKKIFMQGGVCYNRAVPTAMASLTGRNIVVPPEPGLVGAFGVALEVKKRIRSGMLKEKPYSLTALKERTVERRESFVCSGGNEGCDRKCEIARIRIEGNTYPFGGACNRWYNIRSRIAVDAERLNLVKQYEDRLFPKSAGEQKSEYHGLHAVTIGINKSFFTNTFYPLYQHFFTALGFQVALPERMDPEGIDHRGAAFCYPAELAHGYFLNLLSTNPDYLFLPHIKGLYVDDSGKPAATCPLSQGEPYYLSTAFKDNEVVMRLKEQSRILKPVLDFSQGYSEISKIFVDVAGTLGIGRRKALAAFREAWQWQEKGEEDMRLTCRNTLRELEDDPDRFAIVIVGRHYNAFVSEANMGIPQKIASRGVAVLPYTFLPSDSEEAAEDMYWAAGRMIMKGVQVIKGHQQLFPCYISNFSCGPDSFLLEYFRHAMGQKPSLILELDSHVADAGLETRIEAFLDIVHNYRRLERETNRGSVSRRSPVRPACFDEKRQLVIDSRGQGYDLRHPHVHVLFPSMGAWVNEAAAAVFRSAGIGATALLPADNEVLKLGRANTSGKECLPLLLTLGSLLKYIQDRKNRSQLLVYFMPTASGPCRFGQYSYFIRHMIEQLGIEDVTLLSLQAENSYKDLGGRAFSLKLWSSTVLSEIFQDIHSLLLANARDRERALSIFREEWKKLLTVLETSPDFRTVKTALAGTARAFKKIAGIKPWPDVPTILLTGEIFVRHDDLSRQLMIDTLADQGYAVKTAGLMEWVYYTDYCVSHQLSACRPLLRERTRLLVRSRWMKGYERGYKRIMAGSGLSPMRQTEVKHMIQGASDLINPQLTGEAILTIGGALTEVPRYYCGAIAIGPFGCMPNRLAEAILSREMGRGWQEKEERIHDVPKSVADTLYELPFLAIESDGNPFPQGITAQMEVFLAQAERLHQAKRGR